jgi:hypothetical protein
MKKQTVFAALVTAITSFALTAPVHAANEADAAATTLGTDGSAAINTVGGTMLTLAGLAVVYKWAKAQFFS